MPAGLRIDYNDGGPVMEITAGLRCPSFGGVFPAGTQQTKTVQIPEWQTGARALVIPRETLRYDAVVQPNGYRALGGYTVSASGLVTQKPAIIGPDTYTFPATVWQILPIDGGGNVGLLIANSSDFFSVTTASRVGQCLWRGTVNIPAGGWSVPSFGGFDRSNYIVFGKWSNANVTIDFDGSTVRAFTEAATDGDNPTTATIDIVIFGAGVAPVPGNGLNIIKANGQCVFSTDSRPFIYNNQLWNPTRSWVSIGAGYVPLGRFGAVSHVRPNTNDQYVFRMLGVKMYNNQAMLGRGKYIGWDVIDIVGDDKVIAYPLPVIPDMY